MPFRPWTREQSDYLASVWRAGYSFSELAQFLNEQFGVSYYTRSAIGGKVARMALRNEARVPRAPKPRARRVIHLTVPSKPVKQADPPSRDPAREPRIWCELIELTRFTCRYPYGDRPPFAYCGCPVIEGSPYCPFHTRLCWNNPPPTPQGDWT
jgi:hypothetical protein